MTSGSGGEQEQQPQQGQQYADQPQSYAQQQQPYYGQQQQPYGQQEQQPQTCNYELRQFMECAQNNPDISLCQGFNEALKQCKQSYGEWVRIE